MKAFRELLKNELKMSLRGMDMLIFAVIMPIVVLVILGIVFGQKPAFEGAEYSFLDQSCRCSSADARHKDTEKYRARAADRRRHVADNHYACYRSNLRFYQHKILQMGINLDTLSYKKSRPPLIGGK